MPLFPLDSAFLPGTRQGLNIVEPRYCDLCRDVVLSGARRFAVPLFQRPSHPSMPRQPARMGDLSLAEVAAVYYIEELQKAEGLVKYILHHKVIGRVRIKRLLNPRALVDRTTYARAVVEDFVDTDTDAECSAAEEAATDRFREVVALHADLGDAEPVRFVDLVPAGNMMTRGDDGGLWQTANLWQALFRERVGALRTRQSIAEQRLVVDWLKRSGKNLRDLVNKNGNRMGIRLQDLPEAVQLQYWRLREEFEEEAAPLARQGTCFGQALLQADTHTRRLEVMETVMGPDRKSVV